MAATRVYLEQGEKWVFAVALDWPGWCRRAKTSDLAVAELERYRDRYARIVSSTFSPGPLEVIGSVPGGATTDFGAPGALGPWDDVAPTRTELARHVRCLQDCWSYFDGVVASAPAQLRKGPRDGGRDRDAIAAHVREAERAYASKVGARIAPRTPWPEQREVLTTTLRSAPGTTKWPIDYAIRRTAWHITDHAWEIEDRSL
jgi:hypothetical protein